LSDVLWQVAVDAPIDGCLTYKEPVIFAGQIFPGSVVKVPLGKRHAQGIVVSKSTISPGASDFELKEIQDLDLDFQPISAHNLKWLEWMAKYYQHPIGRVTSLALPPLKKQLKQRKSNRPPVVPKMLADEAQHLTDEQNQVFHDIRKHKDFSVHLLFGVTGSGKTEVYLQLLDEVLKSDKRGLVLVPEISLTPQLVHRFSSRFGNQIAVLHSQLTDRERANQWFEMSTGEKKILIGARSALFCPVEDWGLIIVDEEHEPSFKQDEKLKYHGRDAAIMLGKFVNCPVVLGSATPSLESYKNATEGKYHLHRMTKRVQERSLPQVHVVDMRAEIKRDGKPDWLSESLFLALQTTLEKKEQSALFLNRRGLAQVVLCRSCGYTSECPNCDISLTLHAKSHLVCHYCDYHEDFQFSCPSCKEGELSPVGLGTEKIEEDLRRFFPEARLARADRDEIQNRVDMENLILSMEKGEIDILIGTQMIAKGLDFPKLNLVGLVLADIGFNLPDFRSTERSFQLLTQVSGRAGRHVKPGESPGQVYIQTYNPDHPSLEFSTSNNFNAFAEHEMMHRSALLYPPFGRLISFRIQGNKLNVVQEACSMLAGRSRKLQQQFEQYSGIEILGPAEAAIAKLRGQFRYHLLLKGQGSNAMTAFSHQVLGNQDWIPAGVRISVDVDPVNLL
jgi:primosomal protein N' (replication factor Y)